MFGLLDEFNVKPFRLIEVVKLLNMRSSNLDLHTMLDKALKNPEYQPRPLAESLPSALLDNPKDRIWASGAILVYVYKILLYMSMGSQWDPVVAQAKWDAWEAEHPDLLPHQRLSFLGVDLTSERRFRRVPLQEQSESNPCFRSYTMEDWGRAWVLLNYLRECRDRPWTLFKAKREPARIELLWRSNQTLDSILAQAVRDMLDYLQSMDSETWTAL